MLSSLQLWLCVTGQRDRANLNKSTMPHEYTYEYNVKGVNFDKIGMRQVASAMYKVFVTKSHKMAAV